jgi:hypothetical protein
MTHRNFVLVVERRTDTQGFLPQTCQRDERRWRLRHGESHPARCLHVGCAPAPLESSAAGFAVSLGGVIHVTALGLHHETAAQPAPTESPAMDCELLLGVPPGTRVKKLVRVR